MKQKEVKRKKKNDKENGKLKQKRVVKSEKNFLKNNEKSRRE